MSVAFSDLGFMRDNGYIQISGRLKDMVIRGGENIFPKEIEDTLFTGGSTSCRIGFASDLRRSTLTIDQ